MKYKIYIGIFLLIIATLSCKIYTPQTAPIPLMNEKNELQLVGGLSFPAGVTGSAAYSPLYHFALQAHAFSAPQKTNYFQGMVGYYWKNKQNLNFEIYSGYAKGKGKAMKAVGDISMDGNYELLFTQFNLGQNRIGAGNMDYGFGLKAGYSGFNITDHGYYDNISLDPVYYNNKYLLLEPMAFIRIGKRRLRTCFQINGASFINASLKQEQIPYHSIALGVSMVYKMSIIRNESKKD
jgi:hypothetical protein